jgi:ribosomal protein L17
MRHKMAQRKLNKPTDQRMALLKNQVQALFTHEKLVTTEARAKDAPGGNGGYTRITKMPDRRSDAAPRAILTFVE